MEAVEGTDPWLATDAWLAWLATVGACTRAGRDAKDGTDACEATDWTDALEGWLVAVVVTVKNAPWANVVRPRPVELFEIALTERKVRVLSPKSALKSIVTVRGRRCMPERSCFVLARSNRRSC